MKVKFAGWPQGLTLSLHDTRYAKRRPRHQCSRPAGPASVVGRRADRHRAAAANLVASCRPGRILLVGVNSYLGKIRQYLALGKTDEAQRLAGTHFAHTVSDAFDDYCFTPDELTDLLANLGCRLQEMTSAPTICANGCPDLPQPEFARALTLERRFLGTSELLGDGEQLLAVFRKQQRSIGI